MNKFGGALSKARAYFLQCQGIWRFLDIPTCSRICQAFTRLKGKIKKKKGSKKERKKNLRAKQVHQPK